MKSKKNSKHKSAQQKPVKTERKIAHTEQPVVKMIDFHEDAIGTKIYRYVLKSVTK